MENERPERSIGKASPAMLAILYDSACGLCKAGVEAVYRFDNSGMIEAIDLNGPEARAQFPDLSLKELRDELHAVDDSGQVFRGARAINEILRRQRGIAGWLAYLWYVPGYAWMAEWQYRRISVTRYQRNERGRLRSPPPPASDQG
jgi:predicted DCC family thiol-disulfide oxidoreductase YuxK